MIDLLVLCAWSPWRVLYPKPGLVKLRLSKNVLNNRTFLASEFLCAYIYICACKMFVYIHILKHAYEFIWSMARYDAGSQSYIGHNYFCDIPVRIELHGWIACTGIMWFNITNLTIFYSLRLHCSDEVSVCLQCILMFLAVMEYFLAFDSSYSSYYCFYLWPSHNPLVFLLLVLCPQISSCFPRWLFLIENFLYN